MKFFLKTVALCVTICLTGCFSLDTAKLPSGDEHVVVRNYGWVLFNSIPLVCGNITQDAWFPWAFFRNDVTMDKIQSRFMGYARKTGAKASDLKYTDYDTVMFDVPLLQYPLPIPYVLCYREIQLSGVLK